MFRVFMWSAVAVIGGGAALFIPIDPTIMKSVGLVDSTTGPRANLDNSKFIGGAPVVERAVRVTTSLPAPSRDLAKPGATTTRVHKIAIAPTSKTASRADPMTGANAAIAMSPPAPISTEIVRGLQSELRRVGCYTGRVDGDWGPASRFAMAAFVRAANAALPTERPDRVLLSLVRRHQGRACGAAPMRSSNSTTAAVVPRVRVREVAAWQTRVKPLRQHVHRRVQQQPRLLQPPILVSSGTHAFPTPVIRRTAPADNVRRRALVVADPFARSPRRTAPFTDTRMSLGVRPSTTGDRPSITSRNIVAPQPYRVRPTVQPRFAEPQAVGPRLAAPDVRANAPLVRRNNAKRRRYSRRRRGRSRNWRKKVFPGLYN